jgi:hypothetical protein
MKNRKNAILMVVGLVVALLFASAAGATAGMLIGSNQIKDGSIRSVDLKNGKAVGEQDLKPDVVEKLNKAGTAGPAGPQGPKGDTGNTGPQGPSGAAGSDGADGFGYVSAGSGYAGLGHHAEWPADGNLHETVQKCKAGEVITGGGFSTWGGAGLEPVKDVGGDADVQITVSAPYIESDGAYVPVSPTDSRFAATLWVVRGYNNGESPVDVRAWALCTKVNG